MQLARYEAARTALAEAHRVDEVKDIRDKAEAMAAYARQAKDSELIEYATEIKVRAERRCGELLTVSVEHGGDRRSESRSKAPTLNDMGLTRDESSRYQQLAAMPDDHFETAVATAKATAGEVTTAFMLREARRVQDKPAAPAKHPRAERVEEMRALAQSGHNAEQIAEAQGISVEHARKLMGDAGIVIAMARRGRAIDPNKIVRESVAALSGIAYGLTMAHGIDIDAAEANDLLTDLRNSMKALRMLDATLKEIANG
jgi:hypothetical protein